MDDSIVLKSSHLQGLEKLRSSEMPTKYCVFYKEPSQLFIKCRIIYYFAEKLFISLYLFGWCLAAFLLKQAAFWMIDWELPSLRSLRTV